MSVNEIELTPELAAKVRRFVQEEGETVKDFVNEAVREHLALLGDQKLSREIHAFERLHPQLVEQYLGKFVALHNERVVDSDEAFEPLFLRIQARFGDTPVLIRQVTSSPVLELRAPSPHFENTTRSDQGTYGRNHHSRD